MGKLARRRLQTRHALFTSCPSAAHHLARLCLGAKAQPLGGPSLSKTQVNPLIPTLETQRQPLQLGADQGAAEGLGMRGPHGQTLSPQ